MKNRISVLIFILLHASQSLAQSIYAGGISGDASPACAGYLGGEVPFPIKLLSFTARCDHGAVRLDWYTATESNNDYFTVECSADGIHYKSLRMIAGAGNSNERLAYTFQDDKPTGQALIYRLRQTDYDGAFVYSKPVQVNCLGMNNQLRCRIVSAYASHNILELGLYNPLCASFRIEVYDPAGRLCLYDDAPLGQQQTDAHIRVMHALSPGVYFIDVIFSQYALSTKIVVQ